MALAWVAGTSVNTRHQQLHTMDAHAPCALLKYINASTAIDGFVLGCYGCVHRVETSGTSVAGRGSDEAIHNTCHVLQRQQRILEAHLAWKVALGVCEGSRYVPGQQLCCRVDRRITERPSQKHSIDHDRKMNHYISVHTIFFSKGCECLDAVYVPPRNIGLRRLPSECLSTSATTCSSIARTCIHRTSREHAPAATTVFLRQVMSLLDQYHKHL